MCSYEFHCAPNECFCMHICSTILLPTQQMETHRLRWPGTSQRRVDHPVLLDWACGSLPANVESVGCGVENLDVPDRTTLHCQARNFGWLEVEAEILKRKVMVRIRVTVWQKEGLMREEEWWEEDWVESKEWWQHEVKGWQHKYQLREQIKGKDEAV